MQVRVSNFKSLRSMQGGLVYIHGTYVLFKAWKMEISRTMYIYIYIFSGQEIAVETNKNYPYFLRGHFEVAFSFAAFWQSG